MSFHPRSSCPHVLMSSVVERWVGRLVVVDGWMDGLTARRVVWTYVLQGRGAQDLVAQVVKSVAFAFGCLRMD